jgi:Ser/Thr protein kinase RdoA (MazF antagonist)
MNATAAADLLTICRRLLDPDAQPAAIHTGHNGSTVLRAITRVGEVIVKPHRGPERHRQEIHAYQHWTPVLHEHAPQLLAATDNPPTIIITALTGQPLAEARLPPVREAHAYRQAGELLHALHNAAPPRTDPDMTAWLRERGEQWLALARDVIATQRRAEIRAHLRALAGLAPIPAVPCHLDYTPRNLLISPTGAVAVIDYEHTRYDLAARDLVRLDTRTWTHRPDLKAAFLDGYGPLSDTDRHVITHCSHLDTLTAEIRAIGRAPGASPAQPMQSTSTDNRCSKASRYPAKPR